MQDSITIKPLTKVSLLLGTFWDDQNEPQSPANIKFDFIYGIGTEGLTAFEKDIHGMAIGHQIDIRVSPGQMQSYFEHLTPPLIEAVDIRPPFVLRVEIQSLAPATDRELIHALANKNAGWGGGCDCGCGGCGGH